MIKWLNIEKLMEFYRSEYWSRQPFPSPVNLPNPGIKARSPALWADSYQLSHKGSPRILEWGAYPFSRESSWPRNTNWGLLHWRQILYQLSYQGSLIEKHCKEKSNGIRKKIYFILTQLILKSFSEFEYSSVKFKDFANRKTKHYQWYILKAMKYVWGYFITYQTGTNIPQGKNKRSSSFRSVAQSCPTLCDPMNCSTPGLPVHHQLPEFTQTHVHPVSDAIQPSHPLSAPSSPAPNPSQHQSLFQWVNSSHEVAKVLEFQL